MIATMQCQYPGCTAQIVIKPNGKYCSECKVKLRKIAEKKNHELQERKRQEQRSAKLQGTYEGRVFKPASDADVLHWMRYLIHQVSDVGESSPVVHYRPGTPEFERVAALYN